MSRFRLLLVPAILAFLLPSSLSANQPARFARMPDIAPDGSQVAFSYLGDIWIVPSQGGTARPITMHESHDYLPFFSPDGKTIAFSSNRYGNYDVFTVPVEGGKPTRLTYHSADEQCCGWSPDGKTVLFSSARSLEFPPRQELYSVPVTGGQVQQLSAFEGKDGSYAPNGREIAYVRGPGSWYRKGYRGSSNDEIWISNADGTNNRQLTSFPGLDSYPNWSPDSRSLYYTSEMYGTPGNIVCQELASSPGQPLAIPKPPRQLTTHKDEAVRRVRLSRDGQWLVYECGPDLYVLASKGGTPRKLDIRAFADDKTNTDKVVTYTSDASEFAVSPDEKHLAFVVHGELFLIPRGGGKATRLTEHPANDHSVTWSPDAKKLLFLSDRSGHEDIYALESDDPEHPELVKAHKFKVKALTSTPDAEYGLTFTPDGKRVSFLRNGKLLTMNPDGTDQKVVVGAQRVIDYEWSPDSKWLCYARLDGSFASELYIVPATGADAKTPARNITRYATYNAGMSWSKNGNKIAFLSDRRSTSGTGLFVLELQKPAIRGAKDSDEIDWDDIHLRVKQPTSANVSSAAISNDGKRVAYRAGDDLWLASVDGSEVKKLAGGAQPSQIQWSRLLGGLIYYRDGSGTIKMVNLGSSDGGSAVTVPFKARMTFRQEEEFAEMFDQSWRAVYENFYDAGFHGTNWNSIRTRYRDLVKHVSMREDLYALISLMLGELNASHLGISGNLKGGSPSTAELGLLFDPAYKGPGLKIAEVLKRGPADRRGLDLQAGDIVLSVDDTALTDTIDLSQVLNDKAGETVAVVVTRNLADPKAKRRLELQPVSRVAVSSLMYERWLAQNAAKVSDLSGGKLGYIHIPSMDDAGLDRFVRSLYSDNFDKEAIVIDVRFNGGGFTHDRVLNYLGGKAHTFFFQRHGGIGSVIRASDRKWSKPLVLLINNRSFSDAEIFPSAFRTLGLGKLVGQPTGGFVIGTTGIKLIDGSAFRTPRTGVFTAKGINMEKEGVLPDVLVEPHPDQLARGQDIQLEKAVTVLLEDLAAWKKANPGNGLRIGELGLPAAPPAIAAPPAAAPPTGSPARKD